MIILVCIPTHILLRNWCKLTTVSISTRPFSFFIFHQFRYFITWINYTVHFFFRGGSQYHLNSGMGVQLLKFIELWRRYPYMLICSYIPLIIDILFYMLDLFIFGCVCIKLIPESLPVHELNTRDVAWIGFLHFVIKWFLVYLNIHQGSIIQLNAIYNWVCSYVLKRK